MNLSIQSTIAENTEQAIAEYEKWQTTKFGRDINRDELVHRCSFAWYQFLYPNI